MIRTIDIPSHDYINIRTNLVRESKDESVKGFIILPSKFVAKMHSRDQFVINEFDVGCDRYTGRHMICKVYKIGPCEGYRKRYVSVSFCVISENTDPYIERADEEYSEELLYLTSKM